MLTSQTATDMRAHHTFDRVDAPGDEKSWPIGVWKDYGNEIWDSEMKPPYTSATIQRRQHLASKKKQAARSTTVYPHCHGGLLYIFLHTSPIDLPVLFLLLLLRPGACSTHVDFPLETAKRREEELRQGAATDHIRVRIQEQTVDQDTFFNLATWRRRKPPLPHAAEMETNSFKSKSWSKMNPLPKGVSEPHEPPTPTSWIWTVRLHRPATRAELIPLRIWAPPTRAELIPLRIWAPAQEATRSFAVGPRTCSWTAVVFPQPAPPPKATTTGRHLHSCTNTTSTISPVEPEQTPPERGQRGEDKKPKQHLAQRICGKGFVRWWRDQAGVEEEGD